MALAAFMWNLVPSWVFTLWSFKLVPPTPFSDYQGLFSPLSIDWPFPFGFIYLTLQLFWLSRLFLRLRGCFPRGGPFDVFQDFCHNRLNFTCYPWNLPLPAAAIVKNGCTQNSAMSRGKNHRCDGFTRVVESGYPDGFLTSCPACAHNRQACALNESHNRDMLTRNIGTFCRDALIRQIVSNRRELQDVCVIERSLLETWRC